MIEKGNLRMPENMGQKETSSHNPIDISTGTSERGLISGKAKTCDVILRAPTFKKGVVCI